MPANIAAAIQRIGLPAARLANASRKNSPEARNDVVDGTTEPQQRQVAQARAHGGADEESAPASTDNRDTATPAMTARLVRQ